MKSKFNKIIAHFSLFALLFATSTFGNAAIKGFVVNGKVNLPETTLVVLSKITDEKLEVLDSAYVQKDGVFKFEGEGTKRAIYTT